MSLTCTLGPAWCLYTETLIAMVMALGVLLVLGFLGIPKEEDEESEDWARRVAADRDAARQKAGLKPEVYSGTAMRSALRRDR